MVGPGGLEPPTNGGARGTGAPFGGYKSSGNGREHGLHGLEECLETKAVIMP